MSELCGSNGQMSNCVRELYHGGFCKDSNGSDVTEKSSVQDSASFTYGMLCDAAKLEQAVKMDYDSIDGESLTPVDSRFVEAWFELDDLYPELFGYLFH